jgi:hypothetical protein
MPPNFVLLDAALPDVARLVAAMVRARDAVERQSWWHPQEPTSEEWWADVLADPRARKRERRTDLYRVPEIVTRGRFPDGGESDSTWRTQEARHVGSDTIAPGF